MTPTKTFSIQYRDPNSDAGAWITVEQTFDDMPELPARDVAEDWAYARADKGPYTIREVTR
ncbi:MULTISPECIES: hypothetical protein [Cupriavidus]